MATIVEEAPELVGVSVHDADATSRRAARDYRHCAGDGEQFDR